MKSDNQYYYGLGKRKESVARVFLYDGTGKITLERGNWKNKEIRDIDSYFNNKLMVEDFLIPIKIINKQNQFDIRIHLRGGGISAQAAAIKLGLAKALVKRDEEFRPILKSYKLLTQDTRCKERKKVGKRGARRSPQFTKR